MTSLSLLAGTTVPLFLFYISVFPNAVVIICKFSCRRNLVLRLQIQGKYLLESLHVLPFQQSLSWRSQILHFASENAQNEYDQKMHQSQIIDPHMVQKERENRTMANKNIQIE